MNRLDTVKRLDTSYQPVKRLHTVKILETLLWACEEIGYKLSAHEEIGLGICASQSDITCYCQAQCHLWQYMPWNSHTFSISSTIFSGNYVQLTLYYAHCSVHYACQCTIETKISEDFMANIVLELFYFSLLVTFMLLVF